MIADIQRLVIRAPNPLGDALMALPAMAAMRAAMAGRQLIVAASPGVAPLFAEITVASPDVAVVVDKRNEAAQLRELRADAVVLLTNSFRTAWVARQAAIPQRWGYRAHARSLLLTRAVAPAAHPGPPVRVLPAPGPRAGSRSRPGLRPGPQQKDPELAAPRPPRHSVGCFESPPRTRARTDAFLAQLGVDRSTPLVGLAPGAAYGHAKRWPPQRVAELVARLTAARRHRACSSAPRATAVPGVR